MDSLDYKEIMDYRGYWDQIGDVRQWRSLLRKSLYVQRKGISGLTRKPCPWGFDLHESIFSRTWLPKGRGQELLFAGPNCLILSREEHIPCPPDRVTGYWLSVARYTKPAVDAWIDSLPFKATPSRPWRDSNGAEVLARVPQKYNVDKSWSEWYNSVYHRLDCEG